MDRGAHFYNCDFQVHTPRDAAWIGPVPTSDDDRLAYARTLIAACREKGLNALAVTDHHCMTFVPFVRRAAKEEVDETGIPLPEEHQIVVFPGMELTLGVPCQALLIFDANFPDDMLPLVYVALAISQNDAKEAKAVNPVVRLDAITSFGELYKKLDEHSFLRGRYIILPNLTDEGKHSIFRNGQQGKYSEMPCVGGYSDGVFEALSPGTKNRIAGKDLQWGSKKVACVQTSDTRRFDHERLGAPSTWIKWATPTAEALRQACLAQESRISLNAPRVPETYLANVSISNSGFLGPVDLELNPQYNALIGGRGTGKSTVLEYIRWTLCDQPPDGTEEDGPNYQVRRSRLIEGTLKPHSASVQVEYILNGVSHVVRRSSADGSVQLKIGAEDMRPCSEDEVRTLLPIQAYSQKQLSDVSVRIDELTRFITSPIKGELDRLSRQASDRASLIREAYAARQRYRELSYILKNRVLEERSTIEQARVIRDSLSGLTETDRELLDQAAPFNAAHSAVGSWQAGAAVLHQKIKDLRQVVESQAVSASPAPDQPATLANQLNDARSAYMLLLKDTMTALQELAARADVIQNSADTEVNGPWSTWEMSYYEFQQKYSNAVQRSSTHTEKLQQLKQIESRIAEISAEATRTREIIASLEASESRYTSARSEWSSTLSLRDDLIDGECAALTARANGAIRVQVRRFANAEQFILQLRQSLSGSRIQSSKIENLGDAISHADQPDAFWNAILQELEQLADYDAERSISEPRPSAPLLLKIGFTQGDVDRLMQHLTPDDWLNLSLTPIESKPTYEFRAREAEYIPFENASAGQQATALLKTLLNQSGPPLIVDQPEEDLDNPVMLEIVSQLWKAKQLRQIVFASHNANLVVNGDAELVVWFGHRTSGDQSRGTVKGEGAIDLPEARAAIKQIMEGGEAAFRLRNEKYGF